MESIRARGVGSSLNGKQGRFEVEVRSGFPIANFSLLAQPNLWPLLDSGDLPLSSENQE